MAANFEATVDRTRPAVLLRGECDLEDVDLIHRAVAELLAAAPDTGVVVDLGGVTFMGSTGLSALIELRTAHPELQLWNVPANVLRVFEITGMDTVFDLREGIGLAS